MRWESEISLLSSDKTQKHKSITSHYCYKRGKWFFGNNVVRLHGDQSYEGFLFCFFHSAPVQCAVSSLTARVVSQSVKIIKILLYEDRWERCLNTAVTLYPTLPSTAAVPPRAGLGLGQSEHAPRARIGLLRPGSDMHRLLKICELSFFI